MRRFWDSNYGGQPYDAVARRKGVPMEPPATVAPLPTARSNPSGLAAAGARAGGRTPIGGHRAGSAQPEVVLQLQTQIKEMSTHLEGLEKERDFYFEKVGLRLKKINGLLKARPSASFEISKFWFSSNWRRWRQMGKRTQR